MLALFFGIGCSFYNYLGTLEISSEIEKVSFGRIQDILLSVIIKSLSHQQILSEPLWTPGRIVVAMGISLISKSWSSAMIKNMGFPKEIENRCSNKRTST